MKNRYKAFLSYSHHARLEVVEKLHSALQQFAKPLFSVRAIRVFRDKTDLEANPGLWPRIEKALDESEYLVLLASPQAATSKGVKKELSYWLSKPGKTAEILIVLIAGSLHWDDQIGDFDWQSTDALPDVLKGRFENEPLYIDLTWAERPADLQFQKDRFRDVAATLCSKLRDIEKSKLYGDDVRQHRNLVLLRNLVVGAILLLLLVVTLLWRDTVAKQRQIEQELARTKRSYYALAMSRIQRMWQLDPAGALSFLQDDREYPPDLRDFTWHFFVDLCRRELQSERIPHPAASLSALSSNGHYYVIVTDDNSLYLYDLSKNARAASIQLPDAPTAVSVSGDGNIVAAALDSIGVWTQHSLSEPLWLRGHKGRIHKIALSMDGRQLASAGADRTLRIWDVGKGHEIRSVKFHAAVLSELVFSPDGKCLSFGINGQPYLLDLVAGQLRSFSARHAEVVSSLAFSADGSLLASGSVVGDARSYEHNLLVFDVDSYAKLKNIVGFRSAVISLAFAPDKSLLAAGGGSDIWLFEVETGKLITTLKGHDSSPSYLGFAGSEELLSISSDESVEMRDRIQATTEALMVKKWDASQTATNAVIDTGEYVRTLRFSADSSSIVIVTAFPFEAWRFRKDGRKERFIYPVGREISDAIIHPFEDVVFVVQSIGGPGAHHGSLAAWDLNANSVRQLLEFDENIYLHALSPDGEQLAVGDANGIHIYSTADGARLAEFKGLVVSGRAVLLPGEEVLAATNSRGELELVDITGRFRPETPGLEKASLLSLSPDGQILAIADDLPSIRLFDTSKSEFTSEIVLDAKSSCLVFSPDGRVLASGHDDGTLRLWDPRIGVIRGAFDRGDKAILGLSFSPDSRRLASITSSGRLVEIFGGRRGSWASHHRTDLVSPR